MLAIRCPFHAQLALVLCLFLPKCTMCASCLAQIAELEGKVQQRDERLAQLAKELKAIAKGGGGGACKAWWG